MTWRLQIAVIVDQVGIDDLDDGWAVTQGCATDDTSLSFVIVDASTVREITQGVCTTGDGWLTMMTLRRCRWHRRLHVSCHVAGKRQVVRCTLSMTDCHTEIWGCRDMLSTRGMMAHTPLGWLITSCLVDTLIFIVLWSLMSRHQIIILLPILPIIGRKI